MTLQQLAIAKVKARGGLSRNDPNAVKKKFSSPEAKEKIKKRVAADIGKLMLILKVFKISK